MRSSVGDEVLETVSPRFAPRSRPLRSLLYLIRRRRPRSHVTQVNSVIGHAPLVKIGTGQPDGLLRKLRSLEPAVAETIAPSFDPIRSEPFHGSASLGREGKGGQHQFTIVHEHLDGAGINKDVEPDGAIGLGDRGRRYAGEPTLDRIGPVPVVDQSDARNAPGEPRDGRRRREPARGSRRPGTGAACCWRAATLTQTRAGDHQGATLHYLHPTLVRGDSPCSASSATPPVSATA